MMKLIKHNRLWRTEFILFSLDYVVRRINFQKTVEMCMRSPLEADWIPCFHLGRKEKQTNNPQNHVDPV